MATPLTRAEWLDECAKLAKTYEDAMTDEAKALVARFRTIAEWLDPEIDMIDEPDVLEAADLIETQAREIERLRGVLGWYEKQANDCRKITREGDDARYALDRDGGERARAALAGDSLHNSTGEQDND